jgi:hypothetical protein
VDRWNFSWLAANLFFILVETLIYAQILNHNCHKIFFFNEPKLNKENNKISLLFSIKDQRDAKNRPKVV